MDIEEFDLEVDLDTDQLVRQLMVRVLRIDRRTEQMMGALEDLQAADANLASQVGAVETGVADLRDQVSSLTQQVADLTAQLGNGVDPASLQPEIDSINALAARIGTALAPPA